MAAPVKRLLPIPQVAAALSCSPRHVYNLIAAGHLATVNVGLGRSKTRVHEDELARYIRANTYGRRTGVA